MMLGLNPQSASTFETSRFVDFGEVSNERPKQLLLSNPPIPTTGPPLAFNKVYLGGAVLSPRSRQRGGARNRADRESVALTARQIDNLLAATAHARAVGLPFTRMITIHWQSAGVPLARMVWATGRFVDLLRKGIARFGSRTTWLWVHESGRRKDGHCHLLAYVPAGYVKRLMKLQLRWLRSITGKPYVPGVIYSRPIGGLLGLETSNPALHTANLEAAFGYMLKGVAPEAVGSFALQRLEPGGRVIGKRCATSQNIGAKARKAKG